jgi:DNA-binding IclR family transcriptional regulator
MAANPPIGSVDKALRALQKLGESGAEGLALTRLAHELSLNKTSLHRTLSALRHRGFVEQDPSGHYRLGAAILALTDSCLREENLRRLFHDGLSNLCARINETCHLGVLIGEQIMYIDKAEPQRAIRIWSEIGWRNPALCTALGRAIVCQKFVDFDSLCAHFPTPLKRRTAQTRVSMRSLWLELLEARKRGYAIEEQENEPGVTCVALALLRGIDVIAAISITTPSNRMDERRALSVTRIVHECIEPYLPPGLSLQRPVVPSLGRGDRAGKRPRGRKPALLGGTIQSLG